ncbi:hypothetical protein [Bythopirellula polymerisocia]|uniref:Uncharacterized protein n=1 Tax=Bythopirellula polymerisocia TaxID=2528003 RepID=A0A5C6CWT6_9BACT|nr:hypothetical protein [Bythopirellula polymerisocia]TWU28194.1 hypothetical protein Pla144_14810 [Bythopirellula polymerisocia]
MGLIVAFLSLVNIAIGYGLAVYLQRASKPFTPLPIVTPAPAEVPVPVAVNESPSPVMKKEGTLPDVPAAVIEEVAPIPSPEEQPLLAEIPAPVEEPESVVTNSASESVDSVEAEETTEAVDEESVLAGIEAFRAQLANMKDDGEPAVEEIEELAAT